MLNIAVFSYHTLFHLKYDHKVGKTAAAKRLAAKKNISVWEAERQLDAKLFLDEIPKWEPGGPHYSLLCQKMFTHAKMVRLKEYHWGIC